MLRIFSQSLTMKAVWTLALSAHHLWPLDPQLLREDAQDLDDVDGIGRGIPGHAVSIDEALAVKECQQRLFGSAGMDLGIYWAWLPLLYPSVSSLCLCPVSFQF